MARLHTPISAHSANSAPAFQTAGLFRSLISGIAGAFDRMAAAIHVARALENHQTPDKGDLRILGLPHA